MKLAVFSLLLARVAYAQAAATTTAAPTQTVVDLFLGAKRSKDYIFDGSIITADATATTYEIYCKSGDLNLPGFPTTTCDLKDPPWTVIHGPSTMVGVLVTAIDTVTARLAESCKVEARTAAYCNYTFIQDVGGSSTTTSYPTVITGDSFTEYPIAITAGLENLPSATLTANSSSLPTATQSTIPSSAGSIISVAGGLGVVMLVTVFLLS